MTAIMAWFRHQWRAIGVGFRRALHAPDSRDWHVYGGLAIAGVGGWLLSPAWTFIAIGGALVLFGLFGGLLDRWMARTEDSG
ncbi:hypothetical protein LCGC14_1043220 [marine sediment metagenome]|uniref:Uncharacterized protein n=1 Tax=marine sediment metagenome TaxID=412755 RepID=A0A0F9MR60_9ZZZZ